MKNEDVTDLPVIFERDPQLLPVLCVHLILCKTEIVIKCHDSKAGDLSGTCHSAASFDKSGIRILPNTVQLLKGDCFACTYNLSGSWLIKILLLLNYDTTNSCYILHYRKTDNQWGLNITFLPPILLQSFQKPYGNYKLGRQAPAKYRKPTIF